MLVVLVAARRIFEAVVCELLVRGFSSLTRDQTQETLALGEHVVLATEPPEKSAFAFWSGDS